MRLLQIILLFCPLISIGQHLVPNYSFEDTARRVNTPLHPVKYWDASTDEGWNYYTPVHNQQYPDWGVPNNSNGFQVAKTGNLYIGINLDDFFTNPRRLRREYIQLIVCKCL